MIARKASLLVVGLTGSIGMGKSTAALRLRQLGIPVCDADAEVHKLYAGAAVAPIEAAFPGVTRAGAVDRAALAAHLLANPSSFKTLEAIVHPLVQAAERRFLRGAADNGEKIAVLEIPLLLETGADQRVDVTIVVSAGLDQQRTRVMSRPGMTEDKFATILARQLPDDQKRASADYVVDTSGTITATHAAIDKIIAALQDRTGSAFARYWSEPGKS